MKSVTNALAAHYASGTTSLGYLLRLARPDGQTYGFTSAVDAVAIDGVLYSNAQGLDVSSLALNASLSVDNLEMTTLDDGSLFQQNEVFGGVWRGTRFTIGRYNFMAPGDGVEILMDGTIGEVTIADGYVRLELRGLQAALQQSIGQVVSITCRARLGDALCRVDLTPLTFTGTVSAVANRREFTSASLSQAEHYFTEGRLTFTSGSCKGFSHKVKYSNGASVQMQLPTPSDFAVGDSFSIVAGCSKRFVEDCTNRFANALNFQGEPHLPGVDGITQ